MQLSDLVGEHELLSTPRTDVRHPFDPDCGGIAFYLDDTMYFLFEDPDDGYRSSSEELIAVKCEPYEFQYNPDYIRRKVLCTYNEQFQGILEMRDIETGKLLMRVGTDNTDDYYPSFVCEWNPIEVEGEE